MTRRKHLPIVGFVLLLASFAFSATALAQQANLHDPSGSFTGLLDLVQNSAAQWDGRLRGYALTMFWLLASVQFVWTFMPLVFRQADFGEIVGELIRFILVIGFFLALLQFSSEWANAVVRSFRMAGATAAGLGTPEIRPGDIFGTSIELANTIGDVQTINPLNAMMIALAGLVVLLCFAFIAAFMGLTIIESYVVINASVLFMGFGASQWTREYALAIVRYAVAVGAKLFVLTLIVGLIVDSAKTWQAAYNHDNASMWTMVGLALVCALLAKSIPELVAGMISGTSMGGGSGIGGMAAAAVAGAAAAVATIATAGAAAPAAAGALGAAGGGGAAGAGGMGAGLGGAINSSIAGGSAPTAATGAGGASGLGVSTGGQAVARSASSAGARVGGGSAYQMPSSASQQLSDSVQEVAKQANNAVQDDDGQGQQGAASGPQSSPQTAPASSDDASSSSAPSTSNSTSSAPTSAQGRDVQSDASTPGLTGFQIASGITRSAGILSAIAVPGMEGAAGLSLGAGAPQPVPGSSANDDSAMTPRAEPQNIIRPAEQTPVSPTPSNATPAQPGPQEANP